MPLPVAIGLNPEGFRKVLAVAEGSKEYKPGCTDFLAAPEEREVTGVRLFVSASGSWVSFRNVAALASFPDLRKGMVRLTVGESALSKFIPSETNGFPFSRLGREIS